MAMQTSVVVHQDVQVEHKGIEVVIHDSGRRAGRLSIKKATVAWYVRDAKKPTWEGTWEELGRVLSNCTADCEHCGKPNSVTRGQQMPTCAHCGRRFKLEW
jgi:hypothetical protein